MKKSKLCQGCGISKNKEFQKGEAQEKKQREPVKDTEGKKKELKNKKSNLWIMGVLAIGLFFVILTLGENSKNQAAHQENIINDIKYADEEEKQDFIHREENSKTTDSYELGVSMGRWINNSIINILESSTKRNEKYGEWLDNKDWEKIGEEMGEWIFRAIVWIVPRIIILSGILWLFRMIKKRQKDK